MTPVNAPDPSIRADGNVPAQAGEPDSAASLYYRDDAVSLHLGDARAVLSQFPAASVECVVTSPPYWRLRDYTAGPPDDGQYGLEPTAAEYVDRLRAVFAEVHRVLTPTGTVWLNLGDSYSTNSDGYRCARPGQPRQPRYRPPAEVPHKNLLGMPWQVAFALQADGWIIRNAVVWHKPNATPTPTADRLATRYELVFLLVAHERYHFDLDAIRQPYTGDRALSRRMHRGGDRPRAAQSARSPWPPPAPAGQAAPGRNPGDVWTVPTGPAGSGRPPAFPIDLPLRCIAAGCPAGGTVLDPFTGTGTTGLAARQLGRGFIGVDLVPAHLDTARQAFAGPPPTGADHPPPEAVA